MGVELVPTPKAPNLVAVPARSKLWIWRAAFRFILFTAALKNYVSFMERRLHKNDINYVYVTYGVPYSFAQGDSLPNLFQGSLCGFVCFELLVDRISFVGSP